MFKQILIEAAAAAVLSEASHRLRGICVSDNDWQQELLNDARELASTILALGERLSETPVGVVSAEDRGGVFVED